MNQLLIQKQYKGINPTIVTFETGASPDQIFDLSNNTFDTVPSAFYSSPCKMLYDSLLLGRKLPSTMLMNHICHYGNVIAGFLFLHEGNIFDSRLSALVDAVDKIERFGSLGFVGIDRQISILLQAIHSFMPNPEQEAVLSEQELGSVMASIISLLHSGLNNVEQKPLNILCDYGNGFVLADIHDFSELDDFYCCGFNGGAAFIGDRIVLFQRSNFVSAPLDKLAHKIGVVVTSTDNFLIILPNVERNVIVSLCETFFRG